MFMSPGHTHIRMCTTKIISTNTVRMTRLANRTFMDTRMNR
jgi:hypothetical protein